MSEQEHRVYKPILFESKVYKHIVWKSLMSKFYEPKKVLFERKWNEISKRENEMHTLSDASLKVYRMDVKYEQIQKDVAINATLLPISIASVTLFLTVISAIFSDEIKAIAKENIVGFLVILVYGVIFAFFCYKLTRSSLIGLIEKYEMKLLDYQLEIIEAEIERRKQLTLASSDDTNENKDDDLMKSFNLKLDEMLQHMKELDIKKLLQALTKEIDQYHNTTKTDLISKMALESEQFNHAFERLEKEIIKLRDNFEKEIHVVKLTENSSANQQFEKTLEALRQMESITKSLQMVSLNATIESAKSNSDGFMVISAQMKQLTDNLIETTTAISAVLTV